MGIFDDVLNAVGLGDEKTEEEQQNQEQAEEFVDTEEEGSLFAEEAVEEESLVPETLSRDEVLERLEALAEDFDGDLNWEESIVDLLTLLDQDSSKSARVDLAEEWGCPKRLMDNSAEMNMWLHDQVLEKLGENNMEFPA